MNNAVNAGDIATSVNSDEAAERLREEFADLILRINMDLTSQRFSPKDPISVEMAIAQAERSVDYHLRSFPHNAALQALATEIKQKFRQGIEAQASP